MSQPASLPSDDLRRELGEIDIYLFDQLLKGGSIDGGACSTPAAATDATSSTSFGGGFEVFAIDSDPSAVAVDSGAGGPSQPQSAGREHPDRLARRAAMEQRIDGRGDQQRRPPFRCRRRRVRAPADRVVAGARAWRSVLRPARLEHRHRAASRLARPDGCVCPTDRPASSSSEAMLIDWSARLGGILIEPIKTTNVQNQRCMTTWCLEKR